ncbi:protein FAM200C-like [Oratosquilla oratoria]|uniref:protein FAM200C-like n=1 Tax=Oratosquilla oratoria TaxID=337810 RepID=UPI003F766793
MATKKKCRQYMEDYLAYGFVESPHDKELPMCLICNNTFSNKSMKPSRLKEHLIRKHSEKASKPIAYFENLKKNFNQQNTLSSYLKKSSQTNEGGLTASYEIAQLVAKTGNAHTVAENVIKPAFEILMKTVLQQDSANTLKTIPLSNDSIRRRIDEMSLNAQSQLVEMLKTRKFSTQLDESTVRDNRAILMAYVRFIDDNCKLCEEMLFEKLLETDTTGFSIFEAPKSWFDDNKIPLGNLVSCATDGAPSMVGKQKGFIARMKELCLSILAVHCVVHRHHLVAKTRSPDLHESLRVVIKTVNKIKSHSTYDRLFRKFCTDTEREHVSLILHTEVRWLSKGNCLARFVQLFDTIVNFLENLGENNFAEEVRSHKCDIFFLAWIFRKLNEVSLQLQGKLCTLLDCKRILRAFAEKLHWFRMNIQKKNFRDMPELTEVKEQLTE